MLIYFFNHRSICVTHKFGDIFLRHSQKQTAACEVVAQGMKHQIIVQIIVFLETVPVGGDIVAAEITHELAAGGMLNDEVGKFL